MTKKKVLKARIRVLEAEYGNVMDELSAKLMLALGQRDKVEAVLRAERGRSDVLCAEIGKWRQMHREATDIIAQRNDEAAQQAARIAQLEEQVGQLQDNALFMEEVHYKESQELAAKLVQLRLESAKQRMAYQHLGDVTSARIEELEAEKVRLDGKLAFYLENAIKIGRIAGDEVNEMTLNY
jgi:hypothetical protein